MYLNFKKQSRAVSLQRQRAVAQLVGVDGVGFFVQLQLAYKIILVSGGQQSA